MKNIINSIAVLFLLAMLESCSNGGSVSQPTTANGNGIVRGGVTLQSPDGGDTRDIDQSGAKVEVLGTNIVVFTTAQAKDVGGVFVVRGLDSGTYTLRVSKEGYMMAEMEGIYTNGVDSTDIKWKVSDSNGTTTYKGVLLNIQAPALSVHSSASQISQVIRIDTVNSHGASIVRDTTYPTQINFTLQAQSIFDWTRKNCPIGFIAYIDNNPNTAAEFKPNAEYRNGNGELDKFLKDKQLPGGIVKTGIIPNSPQQITYKSLAEVSPQIDAYVRNKVQLYVHIYPFAHQSYTSIITSKYDPPLLGGGSKWVLQSPISIPIEWK